MQTKKPPLLKLEEALSDDVGTTDTIGYDSKSDPLPEKSEKGCRFKRGLTQSWGGVL